MTTQTPAPHPKPSGAPAAARPAAPTTKQAPVNSSTHECPEKAKHPCDVQKLELKTVVVLYETTTCVLKTTKRLRGSPTPGIKEEEIVKLLDTYDLVQDTIASYPCREEPHPREEIEVDAKADFTGRNCMVNAHPLMIVKASEVREQELPPGGLSIKGTSFGPKKFYANRAGFDGGVGGSGILVLFEIVRSIWPLYKPKTIEIRADSCGVRPKDAGGAPNTDLLALIRIYRNDTWAVGIKIPPLGQLKYAHDSTYHPGSGDWERKTEKSSSSGFGHNSTTDERSSSGVSGTSLLDNSEHVHGSYSGNSGMRTSTSSEVENGTRTTTATRQRVGETGSKMTKEDGHAKLSKIEEELKHGKGFEFFIKRNDRDWTKEIGGEKADLAEKIIKRIITVAEAISDIREFFKKLPQVGWKFDFELSLLEGSMAFEWGPSLKDKPLLDRYWPVEMEFALAFEIELIKLELKLSFGVKAKALGTGIEATISGSIGISIPIKTEITLSFTKPKVEVFLRPELFGRLDAVASATLAGWSILDARVSVKAALIMPDGKLEVKAHDGIHLKGTLRLEPTMLTGYIKGPIGRPKEMDPIKLIDEKEVYKFG